MAVSMPIIFGRPQVAYIYFTCYVKAHRWYILCTLWLKGGGHGHFHIAFLVSMFSLGDAETQNSIFKIFRMH